ncbi:MAG: phospholipid carrier-dependent glycosyltransferase, partial [Methanomicrobiales archaeon]|nr:phospholipid carrier-dependent glycosyltransferase [Methanomicrobiales archaeon]
MNNDQPLYRYRMEILLAGILLLSAFLNLWNIWSSGYSNTYYAAAVKSMLENPGVLFFNSFDAGGFVTVDKPPVGLWVQAASATIFGFSGWALVLPQALAGVASVALLYCIISRPFGKPAGLVAAFALAITPIFVAVSRNGTMDGLLIFVILLAVWSALKAARDSSLPYLLFAVILTGIGFNIKMIQAFIVVPAIFTVYFLGAREIPAKKRLLHSVAALAVLMMVSLSWAIVVDSIPAEQRPYIGGSGDNTVLGLIINYNGIHRLENGGMSGPGGIDGPQRGVEGPEDSRVFSRNQTDGMSENELTIDAGSVPPQGTPSGGFFPGGQESPRSAGTTTAGSGPMNNPGKVPPQGQFPQDTSRMGSTSGVAGGSGAPGSRVGGGMDDNGSPGILRLFGSGLYGQITWLLPFALIGLLAWFRKPAIGDLKEREKTGYFNERSLVLLAMCLWLFPGLLYFSFTTGFWHTYYLATIAPPLAGIAGISAPGLYASYTSERFRG